LIALYIKDLYIKDDTILVATFHRCFGVSGVTTEANALEFYNVLDRAVALKSTDPDKDGALLLGGANNMGENFTSLKVNDFPSWELSAALGFQDIPMQVSRARGAIIIANSYTNGERCAQRAYKRRLQFALLPCVRTLLFIRLKLFRSLSEVRPVGRQAGDQ